MDVDGDDLAAALRVDVEEWQQELSRLSEDPMRLENSTMAAHFPINHRLRPVYRLLSGVAGLYMLVFGVVGFVQTSGAPFFTRDEAEWVLGLRTNPAFSLLSLVAGVVVLGANLVGRNLAHLVNQFAGIALTTAGLVVLAVLQTEANVLAFSMVNVIVTFILAGITGTASLYDRVGTTAAAAAEEEFRHGPHTADVPTV